ncbi:MAG: cytochrome c biogenesis protein CcdA [Victivallaceae bacterium]|nr:cytochrome c biogenesis protein CcdA [Victivallaceae bacterium]
MFKRLMLFFALCAAAAVFAADGQPFKWTATRVGGGLDVVLTVAPGAYVYAESVTVNAGGEKPETVPVAVEKYDPIFEHEVAVFGEGTHRWEFPASVSGVTVDYQGCSGSLCYPPASLKLAGDEPAGDGTVAVNRGGNADALPSFQVVRSRSGLMNAGEMVDFLNGGAAAAGTGIVLLLVGTLLGGVALNLTPCVLPLIPVNLAIIGAGRGESRFGGLVSGLVYGFGMAAAYGVLGLLSAFAGAKFGTLNAMPAFNLSVAGVFVLLSLAMFGVFNLDFTRFAGGRALWKRGRLAGIFLFGVLAALLAGACVAPVVVSTLLLAAGGGAAVLMPFLLGVGMALPWPFAGAGLAVLPKPGAWMRYVKWGFGVLIVGMACFYGWLGVKQLRMEHAAAAGTSGYNIADEVARLSDALASGRSVFIDVWSTSCKNCLYMDRTTFQDGEVKKLLKNYEVVKFQIEDYGAPAAKLLLERLNAPGLPTVAVLENKK